jgi:hypothetical protein
MTVNKIDLGLEKDNHFPLTKDELKKIKFLIEAKGIVFKQQNVKSTIVPTKYCTLNKYYYDNK